MGNRLREGRFFARVTQDQLKLETGIDQARISRIERGYLKPREEEKKKLALALRAKVDWLFPKEDKDHE